MTAPDHIREPFKTACITGGIHTCDLYPKAGIAMSICGLPLSAAFFEHSRNFLNWLDFFQILNKDPIATSYVIERTDCFPINRGRLLAVCENEIFNRPNK